MAELDDQIDRREEKTRRGPPWIIRVVRDNRVSRPSRWHESVIDDRIQRICGGRKQSFGNGRKRLLASTRRLEGGRFRCRRDIALPQIDHLIQTAELYARPILGLREDRVNVEFSQHTGDEMYNPTLGGYSRDWTPG